MLAVAILFFCLFFFNIRNCEPIQFENKNSRKHSIVTVLVLQYNNGVKQPGIKLRKSYVGIFQMQYSTTVLLQVHSNYQRIIRTVDTRIQYTVKN